MPGENMKKSAGGMALSCLVLATVSLISALAKSSVAGLQIWSLHGLLLTIEAAGLSYISHVQSVIAEISSCEETATLLENVRFTQQLVLFAPQVLSVHSHVQTLLPTLSSRQPALRHLSISTLRHLIEKDSTCSRYRHTDILPQSWLEKELR